MESAITPTPLFETTDALQARQPDECIDVCNSLLRGEISAVETYDQAITKFSDHSCAGELMRIRQEHSDSVAALQANVMQMSGIPDTASGAWGTFATAVQGTANVFGENSAISSLMQGEEFGRGEYESALTNEDVMPACKELISNTLLPRTLRHIESLKALKED